MSRYEKLQRLVEQSPDDVFANYGLAMELVKADRLEEALPYFERVLAVDPSYHAAHYHQARTLIALGRSDDARAVLQTGVEKTRAAGDAHAESEMQELLDSVE